MLLYITEDTTRDFSPNSVLKIFSSIKKNKYEVVIAGAKVQFFILLLFLHFLLFVIDTDDHRWNQLREAAL